MEVSNLCRKCLLNIVSDTVTLLSGPNKNPFYSWCYGLRRDPVTGVLYTTDYNNLFSVTDNGSTGNLLPRNILLILL